MNKRKWLVPNKDAYRKMLTSGSIITTADELRVFLLTYSSKGYECSPKELAKKIHGRKYESNEVHWSVGHIGKRFVKENTKYSPFNAGSKQERWYPLFFELELCKGKWKLRKPLIRAIEEVFGSK